jgi:hypothetical protein
MCWYVEFKIEMLDKRSEAIERIEKIIEDFKILPGRRSRHKVPFVKGSISDGYMTALHCDCSNVKVKKAKKVKKGTQEKAIQLLHYPELFKIIMDQPEVKNIKGHWLWTDDELNVDEKKLTINQFLELNSNFELGSGRSYKILKEKYY